MKKAVYFLSVVLLIAILTAGNSPKKLIIVKQINKTTPLQSKLISAVPLIPSEIKIRSKIKKLSSIDVYYAELSEDEIKDLEKSSSFEIKKDRKFYAYLDNSIPQIRADDAWQIQINGTNLTGYGQTVCIIDTGVNYSHPALGGCYGNNNASSNCTVIGGYDFVNNDADPMDDQGHGTHVAGIVASNDTTYRGVAPDAKIIAIKALDSSGQGSGIDIVKGIDWCVSNASKFNISVISLSLGDCSNHSTYCNDDFMAPAINSAVAKNITVVAAAGNGNSGSCTGITLTVGPSSPACVENSTAVGAVDDSDGIRFQRGPLFELLAPGITITSTLMNGGFGSKRGTSMATPHVAGAVAILQQFNFLKKKKALTVKQINTILNSTGKIIDDSSGSGYNFSRIDVYNATLSIYYLPPEITIISPQNNTFTNNKTQFFTCNISSEWELKNSTILIDNSTNQIYAKTINISGNQNTTSFNYSFSKEGLYFWSCKSSNNVSRQKTSQKFLITYDKTPPVISNITSSASSASAQISWKTDESTNTTIEGFPSTITNSSFSKNHTQQITGLSPSTNYFFNITSCDPAGNCNKSTNNTLSTSSAPSSSHHSSSGGGSSIKTNPTYFLKDTLQLKLSPESPLKFTYQNQNHTLSLIKIQNKTAFFILNSSTLAFHLSQNSFKKFNLTSPFYYDLEIFLLSLKNNIADTKLIKIHEPIPFNKTYRIMTPSPRSKPFKPNPLPKLFVDFLIIFISFIIFVIITKHFQENGKTSKT